MQLKQLMIVGIDCYHDSTAGKRSIGALVASLNQSMSRFVFTTGNCHYNLVFMQVVPNVHGQLHCTSFCGFVTSFNFCFLARWFSKCVLQHKGQEIMDGLKMALSGKLLLN